MSTGKVKATFAQILNAQSRTVFVGGLQEKTAAVLTELREFFADWDIEDISLELQRPPYAAFIVLSNIDDCNRFVDEYDGAKLPSRGWILRVQRKKGAREKEEEAELKSAAVRLRAQQAATEGSGGRICWSASHGQGSTGSDSGHSSPSTVSSSTPPSVTRHIGSGSSSPSPDLSSAYGRYGVDAKQPRDPMRLWVDQLERAARSQHQSLEQRIQLIYQMVHSTDAPTAVQSQLLKSIEAITARAYSDLGAVLDQVMFAQSGGPGSGSVTSPIPLPATANASHHHTIGAPHQSSPPRDKVVGPAAGMTPRITSFGPRNLGASFAAIGAPASTSSPPPLHHPQPIHPAQPALRREGSFGDRAKDNPSPSILEFGGESLFASAVGVL